jgi:hypothetical protein
MNKLLNKEIISYIISKLKERGSFYGKVQTMKLMFLVEHFNIEKNKIEKNSLLGNEYRIYYLGPMSFEVSDAYDELEIDKIKEVKIDEKLKEKVDKILELFGNFDGLTLQDKCLELMRIPLKEKSKYFGCKISEIVK